MRIMNRNDKDHGYDIIVLSFLYTFVENQLRTQIVRSTYRSQYEALVSENINFLGSKYFFLYQL